MNRVTTYLLFSGALGALGLLLQDGCGGDPPLQLCGEIPTGGCPVGRGGTCDDTTCEALYDCVSGAWTRTKSCPMMATSSSSSSTGAGGAPSCPVMIDYSNQTTDCTPDLETPDCPALAADSCAACDGCDDFLLCEIDQKTGEKGWVAVAFCDDNGHVVLYPQ
jgi:hypothetical protein